jgi:hypothetical protein
MFCIDGLRSYYCVCNCWLKSSLYATYIVRISPTSHSCGQITANVWLTSLQSDNRAFHYVDWSNEPLLCNYRTSKQAHFASCVQRNWIPPPVRMKYGVTQGVFSSKPVQGKKFLETCRSKFVCRFPAVIISSKSIIQELVNKFLTGYLLEKTRDCITCSFIKKNTGLYRNTYNK